MNQLILGDNLEILKKMNSESVDLIYLDPPFFSNRNYEVIWGDSGEIRSFQDRFSGGIDHYIAWLKERVVEMHRILKPTGSIFLHCDWHANAYIRVFILDKIFGDNNFINEIVWKRTTTHNDSKQGAKHFGRIYDTIFLYSKSIKFFQYKTLYEKYSDEYTESTYNKIDENGKRFKASDLSAAKGGGDTSFEWKGVFPPKGRFWAYSKQNFEKFESEGKLYYSSTGKPYLKQYLEEMQGKSVDDIWDTFLTSKSERIGYPTQKPEKLLERIIECASTEGGIVLDPFVGGGTTVAVAERLKRQWIGIDQSVQAVKVTEMRLNKQMDLFSSPFVVQLHKYDYETLRYKEAFEFEAWIVQQYGGYSNTRQRGDLGIDGRTVESVPIQVKRSDNIGRNVVDNFLSAVQRYDQRLFEQNKTENKAVGVIIAFSFGKGAIQEVARLKNEVGVIIKLVTVEEIVPISKKPNLEVTVKDLGKDAKGLQEIELLAVGSSAVGIEFYSWDMEYDQKQFKSTVLLDKVGKQTVKLKSGLHHLAVKVVDNDGLENTEVIKIKINGVVKVN
jgi:DNA modification methylase